MRIRWAFNHDLSLIDTEQEVDEDTGLAAINDGWAVRADAAPGETHDGEGTSLDLPVTTEK